MTRIPLALILAIYPPAALPTAAVAQERPGQPDASVASAQRLDQPAVMAPPPHIDRDAELSARFAAAYRRARSPRVVVFWNRRMTDDVESERETYATTQRSRHADASSRQIGYSTWDADHVDRDAEANSESTTTTRVGTSRIDAGRRDTLNGEAVDFDMERGFTATLTAAGVRLVDRTAMMRKQGLRGGTDNVQALETRGTLTDADLTLEVVPMEDARRASGISSAITARDLASGRVVAQISSDGRRASGPMPYVAGPSGFVRATPAELSAYAIGRGLALAAMTGLSSGL